MAAHRSTGKQSRRSTDTRSRWTAATDRRNRKRTRAEPLQLPATRTRAKRTPVPADPSGQAGLIVCRPTVHALPHLGHAKADTPFDCLARPARTRGFAVTYVQNITDVD